MHVGDAAQRQAAAAVSGITLPHTAQCKVDEALETYQVVRQRQAMRF